MVLILVRDACIFEIAEGFGAPSAIAGCGNFVRDLTCTSYIVPCTMYSYLVHSAMYVCTCTLCSTTFYVRSTSYEYIVQVCTSCIYV